MLMTDGIPVENTNVTVSTDLERTLYLGLGTHPPLNSVSSAK